MKTIVMTRLHTLLTAAASMVASEMPDIKSSFLNPAPGISKTWFNSMTAHRHGMLDKLASARRLNNLP